MNKLILMRHGESAWNNKNLFTGWVDIPLSEKGIQESLEGGKKIKDIPIDVVFVSSLVRSQMTCFLAMLHHSSGKVCVLKHPGEGNLDTWAKIYNEKSIQETIPVFASWHLNERMYGALQGLNKAETMEKFGKEQVQIWRRSYNVAPPEGESLEMTAKRTLPYFDSTVVPWLKKGKNVFISAHGNSLRSIIMEIEHLTGDEIVKRELTTGEPIIYDYDNGIFKSADSIPL